MLFRCTLCVCFWIIAVSSASACDWLRAQNVRSSVAKADVIFAGIAQPKNSNETQAGKTRFKILKVYKGVGQTDELMVFDGVGSCGVYFEPGKLHIVLASFGKVWGELTTDQYFYDYRQMEYADFLEKGIDKYKTEVQCFFHIKEAYDQELQTGEFILPFSDCRRYKFKYDKRFKWPQRPDFTD